MSKGQKGKHSPHPALDMGNLWRWSSLGRYCSTCGCCSGSGRSERLFGGHWSLRKLGVRWWVERMVVATNALRQADGLWSCWFLRFLFVRRQRCGQWEVNGSFRVKVVNGIAGTVRLFGNHHPGGSCGER